MSMIKEESLRKYARSKQQLVRETLLEATQAGIWLTEFELRKMLSYEGNGLLNAIYHCRYEGYGLVSRKRAPGLREFQLRARSNKIPFAARAANQRKMLDGPKLSSQRRRSHGDNMRTFANGADAEMFEVINLDTDNSHGKFESLERARGCVRFDRLRAYSIWHGNVRVECCDPYDGDDDRAKQGMGEPNASEN